MPHIATYLTYREHLDDVEKFRFAKRQEEAARKAAFADKKLTPEEINLANKRGEILKRTVEALDEFAQTKTEDVESVTQTVLGESTSVLTAIGVGIGKLYQSTEGGRKLTKRIASHMGSLKSAAPAVIPGASGLLFAVVSSFPLLYSLSTIEIQTPRVARFEALKGELSNVADFAVLTDEQTAQVQENIKNISVPAPKPTDKGLLSSLNIFAQLKSYMGIVTKRAIYRKDKAEFEMRQNKKYNNASEGKFSLEDIEKADETREITQRLVNKIDLEAQDYNERVFKTLDVVTSCLYGLGVAGYWAIEKAMGALKIKDGKFKRFFPVGIAIAGIVMLNSKVAEYRNNAIRISRHKQLKEMLADPTNFLKTPQNLTVKAPEVLEHKKENILSFLGGFFRDLREYEDYTKTKMVEDKKFKIAARKLNLSPEQIKEAKLNQINMFKMINKVDDNKRKFEEKFEILATVISTPMELVAATLGNSLGWVLHRIRRAPKSSMPLYSIIGTAAGLAPALAIELYTTKEGRNASRVAYMSAQKELDDKKIFLDYSNVKTDDNPFLRMSFKNKFKSGAFKGFN